MERLFLPSSSWTGLEGQQLPGSERGIQRVRERERKDLVQVQSCAHICAVKYIYAKLDKDVREKRKKKR